MTKFDAGAYYRHMWLLARERAETAEALVAEAVKHGRVVLSVAEERGQSFDRMRGDVKSVLCPVKDCCLCCNAVRNEL